MLSHEIADRQHKIYESLHGKHLQRAFTELKKLTEELQDWNIDEELATLETSYRYMIQYMLDGVKDPERIQVYNHLIVSAYRLTDAVCEKLLSRPFITARKEWHKTMGKASRNSLPYSTRLSTTYRWHSYSPTARRETNA